MGPLPFQRKDGCRCSLTEEKGNAPEPTGREREPDSQDDAGGFRFIVGKRAGGDDGWSWLWYAVPYATFGGFLGNGQARVFQATEERIIITTTRKEDEGA